MELPSITKKNIVKKPRNVKDRHKVTEAKNYTPYNLPPTKIKTKYKEKFEEAKIKTETLEIEIKKKDLEIDKLNFKYQQYDQLKEDHDKSTKEFNKIINKLNNINGIIEFARHFYGPSWNVMMDAYEKEESETSENDESENETDNEKKK